MHTLTKVQIDAIGLFVKNFAFTIAVIDDSRIYQVIENNETTTCLIIVGRDITDIVNNTLQTIGLSELAQTVLLKKINDLPQMRLKISANHKWMIYLP